MLNCNYLKNILVLNVQLTLQFFIKMRLFSLISLCLEFFKENISCEANERKYFTYSKKKRAS